jgi:class 3 adenylate cyclase/tetratricopeptide (TPR) repeat protein
MPACPTCAADHPEGARFCATCGAPLAVAGRGHEVRKTVTVLFADVAGSTELGERLDPEVVRARMARYFELARSVIEAHGGTVEKFIGDAVMAVFGVPIVHEDDALRAVRAAAELRDAMVGSGDLAVRVGVNTGEVIAGEPTERGTFVTGDAVNVAARLQAAASVGDVLVGEATVVLVNDVVELGPRISLEVKGKGRPIEARPLLAVSGVVGRRSRPDAPLVGRRPELLTLERTWTKARDERRPTLLTLVAPAGVGKSRLVAEFLTNRMADTTVLVGHCLSYGDGITYWPIREIVHAAAGIDERDGADAARAKVEGLLAGERDADVLGRRIGSAMGLSAEAAPQEELFWAIRRLLEAISRRRPLLVVVEDLHWAQATLLDLIEYAVDLATDAPLLVVATARPELLEDRPSWAAGRPNASVIRLEPLGNAQAAELLDGLPGGDAVPDALRRRILAAAEGTPLYVEEFVGLLRDEGHLQQDTDLGWVAHGDLGRLEVPPTVRALLAARLDGLPAPERVLAERASVVGRSFESAMLGELDPTLSNDLGRRLLALVRKELLRPDRAVLTSSDAFSFRHVLIRDAAYEALPKADRAVLHERFAGWLERSAGERLAEYEEIVGYHLEAAHRYRVELGEAGDRVTALAGRAGTRLAAAGQRAFDRGDMAAAESLLSRAAAAFPVGSPDRLRLLSDIGFALFSLGRIPEADSLLRAAVDEASAADEPILAMRADLEAALVWSLGRAEFRQPLRTVHAAIPRLEQEGDDLGLARAYLVVATAAWGSGRSEAAVVARRRALDHATKAGDFRTERRKVFWGAEFYGPTPALQAIEALEAALAGEPRDYLKRAEALFSLTGLYAMRGCADEAREAHRSLLVVLDDVGAPLWAASAAAEIGAVAELIIGDPGRADRLLDEGIVQLRRFGATAYLSNLLCLRSVALAGQGRWDVALEAADQVIRERSHDDVLDFVLAQTGRAIALRGAGSLPAAVEAGREAVRGAEATDWIGYHTMALMALAEALLASGEPLEATQSATRALAMSVAKEDLMGERRAARFLDGIH